MKRNQTVILLVLASVVFGSCSKFSNGNLAERYDTIAEPFHNIELCDNVNVTLKNCDSTHIAGLIHIATGENLIDDITATIHKNGETNRLVIHNNNTFDFLRPYDAPIEMTVWYDSLYTIIFNSNGIIRTADTINSIILYDNASTDSITRKIVKVQVVGGSGELHLLLNGVSLYTDYQGGTSSIYAEGYSKYAHTKTNYECHGLIDYSALETRDHHIFHHGTNKIKVMVFKGLKATNYNNGEIWYKRFEETTWDFIPADEEHPWGSHDWIKHYCPESVIFNNRYINGWTYSNDLPGLVKYTE